MAEAKKEPQRDYLLWARRPKSLRAVEFMIIGATNKIVGQQDGHKGLIELLAMHVITEGVHCQCDEARFAIQRLGKNPPAWLAPEVLAQAGKRKAVDSQPAPPPKAPAPPKVNIEFPPRDRTPGDDDDRDESARFADAMADIDDFDDEWGAR